jgi:uncharacterized repeat protein (TIGR01451 family)
MKPFFKLTSILAMALFSSLAMAEIKLTTTAETEITQTNAQGEKITKRVPATRVVPGSEVIYTITAKNSGSEPADDVVVTNPIPKQTVYIEGSAAGSGTDITFSVDNGKSFHPPAELTVPGPEGKPHPATAQDYTHVRWRLQFELKPGDAAPLWYRVRVK